jgi:hypothetical protein
MTKGHSDTVSGYDLIGDIHGHADELIKLLKHLGYKETASGYYHVDRKVIFVGDFIDRGERLRQHRQLLNIVMTMIASGHALAVMGNHEFNALAFHTRHNGAYLRPHTRKNIAQHQAFLNEFESATELKQQVLDFFYTLPLWLELDGLRVIHACWHDDHIATLRRLAPDCRLTRELLIEASTRGSLAYRAIETLLKGVEVDLPGAIFTDKDGHERSTIRIQWWNSEARTLGEIALPFGIDMGAAAELPVPEYLHQYDRNQLPCFIGHYWLDGEPAPLTENIACLDYSVAQQGKLVAYRWSGEQLLVKENFTHA